VLGLFVVFAVASSVSGCMGLVGPRQAEAPRSLGRHPVGVTTVVVQDAERERELSVEVWYPAASHAAAEGEPVIYRVKAAGTIFARLRSIAGAQRNAEPARDRGPLPVVLLSHGAGSSRFANVSLAEVLASHGYLVAAPDHEGHTVDDKVFGISDTERAQSALDRPLDLSRVLDALAERSERPRSLLRGLVDMGRVAVAGHSFGGAAALGLVGARFDAVRQKKECASDDSDRRCRVVEIFGEEPYRYRDARIKAALLITPAGFDLYRADGIAQVATPTLIVGARQDHTTPFASFHRATYEALSAPRYLLDLPDAGHLTCTDVCAMVDSGGFLAKTFGGEQAQDGCGERFLSAREALDRVAGASLPFFDLYLNGNTSAKEELEVALSPHRGDRLADNRPRASQGGTL
jgi:predicted dienelactone hydrolase